MTNTALRPRNAATRPPINEPTAKLNDHVVEASVLAMVKSSLSTRLGSTELRAGSKKPHITVSTNSSGYTSQIVELERTSNMHVTITARTTSEMIITRLRLMRSLITPAIGETRVWGSTCNTNATATEEALPVNSNNRL